ncbi:hypothetical protein DVH05_004857 [Phytophthora capsici]|nr:hypothetical protein DVH05_004856 [Phytophthora capsici]KAG1704830.1 hypothetical protein DVH05_004857 [Phytophthora capsici]
MVRLTSRSYLHLTPEVVDGDYTYPFYAKVVRLDGADVTFRSFEGSEGHVSRDIANEHVSAGEVNGSGRSSLLRCPASVTIGEHVHYGQVIKVERDTLTILSEGEQLVAGLADTLRLSPIVVLLLEHIQFSRDEWGIEEIRAVESTILDRVLGTAAAAGSNDISVIFNGLMTEENFPTSTKICRWINPKTDGSAQLVPASVGEYFFQPPVPQASIVHPDNVQRSSVAEVQELFDPFLDDDDEAPEDSAVVEARSNRPEVPTEYSAKRPRETEIRANVAPTGPKRHRAVVNQDVLIIEKLRDAPDLLERFLNIRKGATSDITQDDEDKPLPGGTIIGPVATPKKTTGASKYAFVPREDQQVVHDRVTSTKYKGKPATVFVKSMIRSEHVAFKTLPGVCTRLFDIQFGSSGLSIRHFARLSRSDRIQWLESGGSNFDKLSATAEFGRAIPASHIDDVIDSVRVFLMYAREYCCLEMIELAENIVAFIKQTLKQVTWASDDLSVLVYWVNDLLEDFRGAAEEGSDLTRIALRCSTDDRLLRDLMFVKVHRQVESMSVARPVVAGHSEEHAKPAHQEQPLRTAVDKKRLGRISRNVLKQLPVQVVPGTEKSLSLCMRFLSKACGDTQDGICPNNRGHFVPNKLPNDVKSTINQRFGGLKDEYKHL